MNINRLHIQLDKVIDSKIQKALTKACMLVEDDAKSRCPVDDGTLRRSIGYEVEGNSGIVYASTYYAPYIEFGTGIFAYDGKGRPASAEHPIPWRYQSEDGSWHTTVGQQPQPFLRPALTSNESNIIKIFEEEFKC